MIIPKIFLVEQKLTKMLALQMLDKSIAHRAWKIALSKSFKQNSNCPKWFNINLNYMCLLITNKCFDSIKDA